MNYLIGTGYTGKQEQFNRWIANTLKHCQPKRIVVLALDGKRPMFAEGGLLDCITVPGNSGHGEQLIGKRKPEKNYAHSGWSATFCSLAMAAYAGELDFVFKEEDALCFGDWVGEMYRCKGGNEAIFGGRMLTAPWMPSHQSVFLIKHRSIPEFIQLYLSGTDETLSQRMVEHRFDAIRRQWDCAHLPSTFVDRMRPLPYDAPIWAAQQFTPEELGELEKRKLI